MSLPNQAQTSELILIPVLFCADLSFCARLATAEALRGVLNVRPITSVLLSVLAAAALVTNSSRERKKMRNPLGQLQRHVNQSVN